MKYLTAVLALATATTASPAAELPSLNARQRTHDAHDPITSCNGEVFNFEEVRSAYFRACLDLKWPADDPSDYPAKWNNPQSLTFPVKGPYYEMPLVHRGDQPWMQGEPTGPHRIIVNNNGNCYLAGYATKSNNVWGLCKVLDQY